MCDLLWNETEMSENERKKSVTNVKSSKIERWEMHSWYIPEQREQQFNKTKQYSINDKHGNTLSKKEHILNRRVKYTGERFSDNTDDLIPPELPEGEPIPQSEIGKALSNTKWQSHWKLL